MKNPWNLESIEDLLFYCCPECNMKSKDSQELMNHALQSHAKSIPIKTQKNFILDLKVIDNDPLIVPSIKKISLLSPKKPLVKLQKLTESKILFHTSPKKIVKDDVVPIAEDHFTKGETPSTQRHENFKCKICSKQYAGTFNIKKHLAKKHKIVISRTSNKQKCNLCKLKFSNIPKLIAHTDEVHKVDNGYQYGKFGIIIGSKADWYYHDLYASHAKKPNYIKQWEKVVLREKVDETLIEELHQDEFSDEESVEDTFPKKVDKENENDQSIFWDPNNKYFLKGKRVDGRKCELCSKSMHPTAYSKHIRQCEKVMPREKVDEVLKLDEDDSDVGEDNLDQDPSYSDEESKIENELFDDSSDQVIDDPGLFLCLLCEEVSSSREELSKHMESKHSNETSELLESKVEVDENVKDNLEVSKTENLNNKVEPPILLQCNICCLDFKTQQEAIDHRDSKHSVEDGWKCDKCDRIFKTVEWWNTHNQNHAKVKMEEIPSILDNLLKNGGISLVKPEKASLKRTNEDQDNVTPLKRPKLETKRIIEFCPPPDPKPRKVFSKPKKVLRPPNPKPKEETIEDEDECLDDPLATANRYGNPKKGEKKEKTLQKEQQVQGLFTAFIKAQGDITLEELINDKTSLEDYLIQFFENYRKTIKVQGRNTLVRPKKDTLVTYRALLKSVILQKSVGKLDISNKNEFNRFHRFYKTSILQKEENPKAKEETVEKSKLKSYADFYAEIPIVEDNYEVIDRTQPTNPKLKCKLCNYILKGTWNMNRHLAKLHKIVISKQSKGYKCYVCDIKFKDYPDLSNHTDEVHKVDTKYKCDKCDTTCDTKNDWYHHLFLAHYFNKKDQDEFPCDQCDKVFDTDHKLKYHISKVHRGEIACDLCGKICSSMHFLTTHRKRYHHTYEITDDQKVKKCDQCDTEFKVALDFDEHLETAHKCDKDFKCQECDTKWVSHLSLELHYIESHKKIFHCCDICGYTTYQPAILRRHKKVKHEGKRDHVCHMCGTAFDKKFKLTDHFAVVHGIGECRFKCSYCGTVFMSKHGLEIHIEGNHEKDKVYTCGTCNYVCHSKHGLLKHERRNHQISRAKISSTFN